ncbi:rhodanese-like domain-containing protein [Pseudotabrizicola sp. 4114]|uniref:sulfurtransferase n=1 Tax=Pseudotabrizicola sp. 4114 TaxID=2817731 RepID=UPI00286606BD|nr:thiosulfate/3-mercaptopyruvate sulfurtransferase [Pseudorhodobacter sp. 4114]
MVVLAPRRFVFVAVLMSILPWLCVTGAQAEVADTEQWVIEADQARSLLAAGALLLDTRGAAQRALQSLPGSTPVTWQEFSNPDLPTKGQLLADDAVLTEQLRTLGVSNAVPVIAVADTANSWGEDGRIVWTLRTLGHQQAYLVNGGIAALLADGDLLATPAAIPGNFTIRRTSDFEVTKEQLSALIGQPDVVIIDTREPREYAGDTPYGETRGGHVPGAKHVYFADLVGADGKVLQGEALSSRLNALGVTETTQVVSYCTAGIRSGFVTAVLQSAGVDARNYAGSMWEWSAQDPAAYPLVTD